MNGYYCILEKNPYPGVYEPMATCWIQSAEWGIGGLKCYHEGAARIDTRRGTLWLYQLDRAIRIAEHAEIQRPNTQHILFQFHGDISPVKWEG